jgi:hypothetical protein
MWLFWLLIIGLAFLLIGGVLLGGIFTIILVPVAIVAALSAIAYLLVARATGANPAVERKPDAGPLPQSEHANAASTPSASDDLVDARQRQWRPPIRP